MVDQIIGGHLLAVDVCPSNKRCNTVGFEFKNSNRGGVDEFSCSAMSPCPSFVSPAGVLTTFALADVVGHATHVI